MRVSLPGVAREGPAFQMTLGERSVEAWPGETIAAALIAAGHWRFRETAGGAPRGPYCGMGVCGECTMLVDGEPRRTCLEPARPGLVLAVQPARTPAPPAAAVGRVRATRADAGAKDASATDATGASRLPGASAADGFERLQPDVLVVGAGPAGLTAACAAARSGADVLVVDERAKFGGQYYKQPGEGFGVAPAALDPQFRAGQARYEAARAAGARFLFGATVWGTFGPDDVAVATRERRLRIRARRLILAPGAYERALPVPGWTLPGVLTSGAAQTLLRAYSVAPGRRVLVAGNGPLNLQVARELARAGVAVVAVAELAPAAGPRSLRDLATLASAAPALVREGLGHVLALRRRGVLLLNSTVLVRCEPDASGTRVGRAVLARVDAAGRPQPGTERTFEVDAVCMGYGFAPQAELARALGCAYRPDARRGTLAALRDGDGRSDVPGVFVVGDAGGLDGARLAEAEGWLAGAAAALDLGHPPPPQLVADLAAARGARARHRRFQDALWRIYGAPLLTWQLAAADTPLCRCEDVSRGALEACFDAGVRSLGAAKRATRAGMGRCQGRYCSVSLAAMAAAHGHDSPDDAGWFAPRTPFKPVRIDELAAGP